MKKVITYGTFDLLHQGHINILKNAKEMGDYLIVALSTDEFNQLKGKQSFHSYEVRKYILESIKYVDKVIPEKSWDQKKKDIEELEIDLFVMGSDWKDKFNDLKKLCEVVYLPRTKSISSTEIRQHLNDKEKRN